MASPEKPGPRRNTLVIFLPPATTERTRSADRRREADPEFFSTRTWELARHQARSVRGGDSRSNSGAMERPRIKPGTVSDQGVAFLGFSFPPRRETGWRGRRRRYRRPSRWSTCLLGKKSRRTTIFFYYWAFSRTRALRKQVRMGN